MGNDVEWFNSVLTGSAGATALLGLAAYWGRAQLADWIISDSQKVKAGRQPVLDAYRVSLIAAAERYKAMQDIRKLLVLKSAEKRFQAIEALHDAVYPMATLLFSYLRNVKDSTHKQIKNQRSHIQAQIEQFSEALSLASLFLPEDDYVSLCHYIVVVTHVESNFSVITNDAHYDRKVAEQRKIIFPLQLKANAIIQKQIDTLLTME